MDPGSHRIDAGRAVEKYPRHARAYGRVLQGIDQRPDPVVRYSGVRVEEYEHVAARCGCAAIAGPCEASVLVAADSDDFWIPMAQDINRTVSRGIVYQDNLLGHTLLSHERGEALLQVGK